MEAGRPPLPAMNAATLAGMYGSRFPFPGALGYQSWITSERGFRPFVPGSCREGSTSSSERVPTGYAPVGAGMTSTGSPAAWRVLAVVAADAVVDATITLITTTPTATETRRVRRRPRAICGASAGAGDAAG